MLKIIVADDELIECKAIEMMLQELFFQLEIIPSVQNGINLIASVKKNKPDIAIVDINMPGMNGLDAIEMIRTFDKQIKIIISSAYSEFTYARRALKQEAIDYIVKPLDQTELQEAVWEAIRLCQKEQPQGLVKGKAEKETPEQRHVRQEVIDILCDQFFSSLLLKQPDQKSLHLLMDNWKDTFRECVFISARCTEYYVCQEMCGKLQERLDEELGKECCNRISKIYNGEMNMVVFSPKSIERIEKEKWIEQVIKRAAGKMDPLDLELIKIGVSSWKEELEDLPLGLEEAKMAAYASEKSTIHFFSKTKKARKRNLTDQSIQAYISVLQSGNAEECERELDRILNDLKDKNELMQLRICMLEFFMKIRQELMENSDYIMKYEKESRPDYPQLMQCTSVDEIRRWLHENFRHLQRKKIVHEKKSMEYINRTLIYMEQNYSDNLSLEQTAEISGISSFYLSRLIKQELRQNFTDILTEIRMTKAVEMIFDHTYSIKEIAEKSGYVNTTYFYKVFKKYIGMNPGEMRDYIK